MAKRPPQNVHTDKSPKEYTLLAGEEVKKLTAPVKYVINCEAMASHTVSDQNLWGWRDGSMVRALAALTGDLGSIPTIHTVAYTHFTVPTTDLRLAPTGTALKW